MCVISAHGHVSTLNMFFFFYHRGFNIFPAARSYILNNNRKKKNNQAWKYVLPEIVFANITSCVTAPPLSKGDRKKKKEKATSQRPEEVLARVCNLSGSNTEWICSHRTQRKTLMFPQQLSSEIYAPLFFFFFLRCRSTPGFSFPLPFYSQTLSEETSCVSPGVKKKKKRFGLRGFGALNSKTRRGSVVVKGKVSACRSLANSQMSRQARTRPHRAAGTEVKKKTKTCRLRSLR